jgi:hypothetical protein
MSSPSLVDFQFQRTTLANRPLKDNKDLITSVGLYYQRTLGSDLDPQYILETEYYLNEIYIKASTEGAAPDLHELITQATALASSLSYPIKNGLPPDADFFARAKRLGGALNNLVQSIK